MNRAAAARLSQLIETVHAVTYFAPESHAAASEVGFKGFWMGYFGLRAAPLGPANAATVGSLFFNFHPSMVRRSVPDAWHHAAPDAALSARATAAATALRRLAPHIDATALDLVPELAALADRTPTDGRALGAANAAVAPFDDPVEALWQTCTTLRELRGDVHVALLVGAGLDGCAAHLVAAAHKGLPHHVLQPNRGWSDDEWQASLDGLRHAGWLDGDGRLTPRGRADRDTIERRTDELAFGPAVHDLADVIETLTPIAYAVSDDGEIPYPNPMGLARLARDD